MGYKTSREHDHEDSLEEARAKGCCKKHPRYQAKRAPSSDCKSCLKIWQRKNAAKSAEELVKHYEEAEEIKLTKKERNSLVKQNSLLKKALEVQTSLAQAPLPPIKRLEFGSGMREATAVFGLSDLHVEEKVKPGDTPTGNAYNLAIAEYRLSRAFAGVKWLIEKERATSLIRSVLCWIGGDTMTGHIHDENKETTAFPPVMTLLWLYPRLLEGIRSLLEDEGIETLYIVASYGNHGRDTKKPYRVRGAYHSYEWGMYQRLADDLKDEIKSGRVKFLADPSAHQYVQVYDFNLHFHHGDEIQYAGGVGGITIPMNKAVAQWDKVRRCDFHHFGHYHQYFDMGNLVGNGSLIGYNGYAMSIKATPEPAQQFFYLLDSKRGKTAKSPIWCEDRETERKLWRIAA